MKKALITMIVCIAMLLSITACSHEYSIENEIENIMKGDEYSKTATIDFVELTDFEWDKMLVFRLRSRSKESQLTETISEMLNMKFNDYISADHGFIFVNDGRIVYQEYYEFESNLGIYFYEDGVEVYSNESSDSTKIDCSTFSPEKATFSVERFSEDFGGVRWGYSIDIDKGEADSTL